LCFVFTAAVGVTSELWSLTDMERVIEAWKATRTAKISGGMPVG
jgi:hypothetical protein